MFIINRKEIRDTLHRMQRQHCAYRVISISPSTKPPLFCDCKYGYSGQVYSENTGCPELRSVVELLTVMTDDEYAELVTRGHHTLI